MEALTAVIAGNALVAFLCVALIYAIGDTVGTLTKAWVPSVFVIAGLFLVGFWTVLPQEVISLAGFAKPFTSPVAIYILITHMGTTISLKDLLKQWKTIVVCLAGLVGMVALCLLIGQIGIVDKALVIVGLPPLTGGIVAAITMQEAAAAKGLELAALLAIAMYVVQGFAGYPLTAIMLKKEGKNLLKEYRAGKVNNVAVTADKVSATPDRKKLIPSVPDKFYSTAFGLLKLAIVAVLAFYLGTVQFPLIGKLNGAVWALILGMIFTELGFLDRDSLHKCGCFNFICFALMLFVFDGLKTATPDSLGQVIVPMLTIIVVGVFGMAVMSILVGKVLKVSPYMAFACSLTALYGFPPNLVLTQEAAKALAETKEENDYLMDNMLPQMIVGGFVTVTITSVIIAGAFVGLL